MRTTLCFGVLLVAMALGGCAYKPRAGQAANAAAPPMLIDSRGVTMSLEQAVTKIAYRPYIPNVQMLKIALIPPLGGADTPEHRGIALEYAAGKNAMLISEWPSQHFPVTFDGVDIGLRPCTPERFDRASVAWSSRHGLVMTLQPDGPVPATAVAAEARRLLANGACG